MITLLEKAKRFHTKRKSESKFNNQDIDLVKAWMKGEIGLEQIKKVKNIKSGVGAYVYISLVCKVYFRDKI